jgi:two-component system, cell cycle response regulator
MVDYNILPFGFPDFEESKLEAFFSLATKRAPHWRLTTQLNEARVVLLNAASDKDVESLCKDIASWQKIIIVGNPNLETGWPILQRPFKLMAILDLLDQATAATAVKASALHQPTPAATNPSMVANAVITQESAMKPAVLKKPAGVLVESGLSVKPIEVIRTTSIPKRLSPSHLISDIVARELAKKIIEANSTPNTVIGRVLLVDDSDIALKYMQNRLRQFSYECELAHSGEDALVLMTTNSYQFVFLDVMMKGLDGYQTCKAIKNNKARRGPAPVVVMLTSRGGTIDKIRGSMSGCDAYLTKPLNDKKLGEVLTKFDSSTITERWEAANPYQPLVDTHFNARTH